MTQNKLVQPLLKWAGGKRQLLAQIKKYIPKESKSYYEPFLGGGAVLFDLQPQKAVVNDNNSELINVYNVVKNNVDELLLDLSSYRYEKEYYYKIRELDRDPAFLSISPVKRASRLIYLNKTCYNGLFRVNSRGEFNTPFGRYKNPNIINESTIRAVSAYLNSNSIEFMNGDFEEAVGGIKKGSFVYFDPPYFPVSNSSKFTGYTLGGFSKDDQIRLKGLCDKLNGKGVQFLLSNSAAPFIVELYQDSGYHLEYVGVNRSINSIAGKRGEVSEILVYNYEIG